MKFGPVPVGEAQGAVLAHSVALEKGRLRKGAVLSAADMAALQAVGLAEVIVARLDPGDLGENAAAERIAAALVPGGRLELALHEGETDLRDTLGRLYCEWSEADLRALIEARGMTIGQVTHRALTGYDGRPITIMAISATK